MVYSIVSIILIISAISYIKIAEHFNIIDKPNHRSSHVEPVIRGAGILFYIAALCFFIASGFLYPYFFIGLSIIAFVSYIDDLRTLSSRIRLVFQFISILLVIYQLSLLINLPVYVVPILLIIGVGFINMFNFMDGINGITGFYALVALIGLYYMNTIENILDEKLIVFTLLAVVIFGFYNFRKKARFFCGDIGSISLALLLFFIITYFSIKLNSPLILLFMGVYLTDAILTIGYRKLIGENITVAHRHHIYQKLVDKKEWSHLRVSALYAVLQSGISIIVIVFYKKELLEQLVIFFLISMLLLFIYLVTFKWLNKNEENSLNT